MTIDDLLTANAAHAATHPGSPDRQPAERLAVVTCMDTRIDPLAAFGLRLGQSVVLRNAGARVTDDVIRSLAVASHALGVDTVLVVQHTGCGLLGIDDDTLQAQTGATYGFLPITDHGETLRADLARLADEPSLAPITSVAALVYDVETGRVGELLRWQRP